MSACVPCVTPPSAAAHPCGARRALLVCHPGHRATGSILTFDGGSAYPQGYRFPTLGQQLGAVAITDAGYVGIGQLGPSHLLHMSSGAHVTVGGVWTSASSRALKDQIAELAPADADAALARLQLVTFVYTADPSDPQVGFIAEDVPDLVATKDRTSLAPMDIVAVLTKVVQAQRQTLASQEAKLAAQETRLLDMAARLAQLETLALAAKEGDRR